MISIDGKPLRHAFEQATATAAIPRVSAWASANRLVVGQLNVDEQSHAMTAMPTRLPLRDVNGAVVTIEARGCQKALAKTSTEPGAASVLALKAHPPTLAAEVPVWLTAARDTTCAGIAPAYQETVDGDHGRLEIRR